MNSIVIPPSPNWYCSSILACSPDNSALIFGAKGDLVVIKNSPPEEANDVQIISRAHSQKIISVSVNKSWEKSKFAATTSEDNIVKIWDMETMKLHSSHSKHVEHGKAVGVSFAGDERVVSVSEDGVIVVFQVFQNQAAVLQNVFDNKVTITCVSSCPHAAWLVAFGLANGLVAVADLRKNGKILYKLRGHEKSVVSLAWCPVPINIFPKDPLNRVGPQEEPGEEVSDNESDKLRIASEYKSLLRNEIDIPRLMKILAERLRDYPEEDRREAAYKAVEALLSSNPERYEAKREQITEACKTLLRERVCDSDLDVSSECESTKTDFSFLMLSSRDVSADMNLTGEGTEESSRMSETTGEDSRLLLDLAKDLEEAVAASHRELSRPIEVDVVEALLQQLDVPSEGLSSSTPKKPDVAPRNPDVILDTVSRPVDQDSCAFPVEEKDVENGKVDTEESNDNAESDERKTCEEAGRAIVAVESSSQGVVEPARKEYLLASAAKEGKIYIWRAGTDGRMQTFLTMQGKPGERKNKYKSDKIWICLCWISPTMLLSSSKSCELLRWTLPKPKDMSKLMSVIHNDHSTTLFSMAAAQKIYNENDWRKKEDTNVWTFGQDRLLQNVSLSNGYTSLACYSTLGGSVTSIEHSPLDPNRLAVGTGDGNVKIWDLSLPHVKHVVTNNFYNKLHTKITALAWHPKNEFLLAFGTTEGRLGYLGTNNKSKNSVILPNIFKSQIYKMEWGPVIGKQNFGLYVVAEGRLVLFDVTKHNKEPPVELEKPDDTFIYSFSWKKDYSILIATTKMGEVIGYTPDLKISRKYYFHERLCEIFWHPNSAEVYSKQANWFAAILAPNKKVVVVDFEVDCESQGERVVAETEGYIDTITTVSWSPYASNQLLLAGDFGYAQIWDVGSGEIISTFPNINFDQILSAIWSPTSQDYCICGGRSSNAVVWKISEHPKIDATDIVSRRRKFFESISGNCSQPSATDPAAAAAEKATCVKKPRNVLLPAFYAEASTSGVVRDARRLMEWKANPVSDAETDNSERRRNKTDVLDVFGTKADTIKMVQRNEELHKMRGQHKDGALLALFRGDIGTSIKEAIDQKRVTPWMISIAPMVSPALWQTACLTYANQMSLENYADPLEIVSYLLACHEVEKAIDCLVEASMYREAFSLAKCRLADNDEIVTDVMTKWAQHAASVGNYETAAHCYISLDKFESAASVLFRRTDPEILELTAELAEKSNNKDLHSAVLGKLESFKKSKEEKETPLPTLPELLSQRKQQLDTLSKSVGEPPNKPVPEPVGESQESPSEAIREQQDSSARKPKEVEPVGEASAEASKEVGPAGEPQSSSEGKPKEVETVGEVQDPSAEASKEVKPAGEPQSSSEGKPKEVKPVGEVQDPSAEAPKEVETAREPLNFSAGKPKEVEPVGEVQDPSAEASKEVESAGEAQSSSAKIPEVKLVVPGEEAAGGPSSFGDGDSSASTAEAVDDPLETRLAVLDER